MVRAELENGEDSERQHGGGSATGCRGRHRDRRPAEAGKIGRQNDGRKSGAVVEGGRERGAIQENCGATVEAGSCNGEVGGG